MLTKMGYTFFAFDFLTGSSIDADATVNNR
jgi:hypothetical protein